MALAGSGVFWMALGGSGWLWVIPLFSNTALFNESGCARIDIHGPQIKTKQT